MISNMIAHRLHKTLFVVVCIEMEVFAQVIKRNLNLNMWNVIISTVCAVMIKSLCSPDELDEPLLQVPLGAVQVINLGRRLQIAALPLQGGAAKTLTQVLTGLLGQRQLLLSSEGEGEGRGIDRGR